ncbi:MAG TPA: TIGR03790 family protein [Lacipirellulaceae bacterium]|nr:TIGR03790 family protein [Lacipirellulaceae bacterium]
MNPLFTTAAAIACVAAPLCLPVRAELLPDQVAIVAARGNRESEQLAAYYAKVRGIPADHVCLVDLPNEEVCVQDHWKWAVRPEIRKWLEEHDPQRKLRCLVTVWGVPLKIGPAAASADLLRYRNFLEAERRQRLDRAKQVIAALDAIAPGEPGTDQPAAAAPAAAPEGMSAELHALRTDLENHLKGAQSRVVNLSGADLQQAASQLQQLAAAAGGARVVLSGFERQLERDSAQAELRSQFDLLRGQAAGIMAMQQLIEQSPPDANRDVLTLTAIERTGGLLGCIEWLDTQLASVAKNETGASFDSELSLVLWADDYELLRWQPNYLRAGFEQSGWARMYPTLMVARIDAPSLRLAKGLIDTALEVEAAGLQGKVYLDSRGMGKLDETNVAPGSYPDYDRALLVAAEGFKESTTLEVTLNAGPELFQSGQCPDAALYCGWYSLAKYVDAFEWRPGAVAYHLASAEAGTLRDPNSQEWCKKLIEDGVAATIGPVYEPYLVAFPRPEQFFANLVQGDLTLVECYYRTLPFNSWMMTLIGDPLYRPFKNRNVRRAAAAPASPGGATTPAEAATPAGAPADGTPQPAE